MPRQARVKFNPEVDDIKYDDFTVFTEYDIDVAGRVISTYPLWYFNKIKEELENDIARMKNAISMNYVPENRIPEYKQKLSEMEMRLRAMNDSVPKFNSKIKEFVADVIGTMSEKLSNALPSKQEIADGLVTAEEEANRMTTPCIQLNEKEARWAKACNIMPRDGYVSRNHLEIMWKIARKILGESTNIELLRRLT